MLPSSTNPPPSSNYENETDVCGYDNTNHMGAPIGTEQPTSIQQSNNPPSKRLRIGGVSDGSYAERTDYLDRIRKFE